MSSEKRLADWIAAAVILLIGGPLIWMGAVAVADGEQRREEAPLRALLGNPAYEALSRGRDHPQHYLGNDRRAPDFALRAEDGSTWRLSDQRGKVVVINFWTVTCQPCLEEMPSLIELADRVAGRSDIELVTVSVDRDHETTRSVVPPGSPLTVLIDPDRSVVREQFGTRQFPETWIVDPEGIIRLRVDGSRDWSGALALEVIESYL